MNWITSLLTDVNSIGHVLLVFTFLISLGLVLGRIKIAGISLGVTCVLFVSLIANYLGVSINATVLEFTRNFGLMLFVFMIGLEVGPSFFSSFKNEGLQLNFMMIFMVFTSIFVMLGIYFVFARDLSLAQILGVYFGAVTCTPGLGASQEILSSMNYTGENIAVGYACAYPLSILGVIGSMMIIKLIFHIDSKEEERKLEVEEQSANAEPVEFNVTVTNHAIDKLRVGEISRMIGRTFICTRVLRNEEVISPDKHTELLVGDKLKVISEPDDKELLVTLFGQEDVEADFSNYKISPVLSSLIRVTREEVNGIQIADLHLSSLDGVNIARVYRSGLRLIPNKSLRLQLGDTVYCVGPERSVNRLAEQLGNQVQKLDRPNSIAIFLGMLVGIIVGSLPIAVPGMPVAMKLGLAGGPLVIAILLGYYGPSMKLVTYTTHSANLMLREFGLALFLSSIGLSAGENFANAIVYGNGPLYVLFGLIITMVPCIIGGVIARLKFKMNFHVIMGLLAGTTTNAPTLAYANVQSDRNTAVIAYSTVYPLATFIRILTGQIILVALWFFV